MWINTPHGQPESSISVNMVWHACPKGLSKSFALMIIMTTKTMMMIRKKLSFFTYIFCALTANLSSEDQVGTQWGQFLIDAHCIFVKCKQSMQWIGDAVFLPLKTMMMSCFFIPLCSQKKKKASSHKNIQIVYQQQLVS